MPKRSLGDQASGGETLTRPIGTWVAAGLSLAVIGLAAQFGQFAVYAAVVLAPMVYVFGRLRRHTPQAQSTSDLVGAVLGEHFGLFTGLIQLVAYVLLGVKFARLVGASLRGTFVAVHMTAASNWFVVASIAAVVAAGLLVHMLSAHGIAWIAALLAAVGILVNFYVAVAIVATIATGEEPRNSVAGLPLLR
jgi:amino acid transporter